MKTPQVGSALCHDGVHRLVHVRMTNHFAAFCLDSLSRETVIFRELMTRLTENFSFFKPFRNI